MTEAIDVLDLGHCHVKDEDGIVLADLYENGRSIVVVRTPACSLGMYFYILDYLREIGFDAK